MGVGGVGCFKIIYEELFDGSIFVAIGELDRGFVMAHFASADKFEEKTWRMCKFEGFERRLTVISDRGISCNSSRGLMFTSTLLIYPLLEV